MSLLDDFKYNASPLHNADFQEVTHRLVALLDWMESKAEIKAILDDLRASGGGTALLQEADFHTPPKARTPQEIAAVGLTLIDWCKASGNQLFEIAFAQGIHGSNAGNSVIPHSEAALRRYIEPFLNYVIRELPAEPESVPSTIQQAVPVAIQESLNLFQSQHPDPRKVCFVMMQFGETTAHDEIERGIKETLSKYGLTGFLARDKQFNDDLYPNIQTYMHGCGFGIAVFERIEKDVFNPNVSLEVGYMLGLKKPVLLLKDQTLPALQTDLAGKLYRPFDPQHPAKTIASQLEPWLEDKGLI